MGTRLIIAKSGQTGNRENIAQDHFSIDPIVLVRTSELSALFGVFISVSVIMPKPL